MRTVLTLPAQSREQPVTSLGAGKWWLSVRSPTPFVTFRVAAASCLLIHFVRLYGRVGGAHAGWHPAAATSGLLFGSLLAVMLAFGMAARTCAASLYIACVAVSRAGVPITTWDDYAATLLTFVLTALPLGNALTLPWRADRAARLPGSSTTVLLVLVCGLYATRGLGLLAPDAAHAQLAINGLALVPVAVILPSSAAQKLGVAVQVLSHAYLMAHGDFFLLHGALACTACLFWGERAPKSAQGPVWDAGAVALTSVLTFAVFGVALQLVGFTAEALRAAVMLRHIGLLPPAISVGG